jgi:hypothetical protein
MTDQALAVRLLEMSSHEADTTDGQERANLLEEAAQRLHELAEAAERSSVAALWASWQDFRDAATPVRQADTLVEFANVIYHYATDILGFDAVHHVDAGDDPAS